MDRVSEKADIEYIREVLRDYYAAAEDYSYDFLKKDAESVPSAMVDRVEDDGEVIWKMLPSTLKPADIRRLESRIGHRLPPMYRAYLQSYFHLFDSLIPYDSQYGRGGVGFAWMPCDDPLCNFKNATNDTVGCFERRLFDLGFLVIGWSIHDRLAFDTRYPDDEGDYEIVVIDHRLENDVFEVNPIEPLRFTIEDVSQHSQTVCDSFRDFVKLFLRFKA